MNDPNLAEIANRMADQIMRWLSIAWFIGFFMGSAVGISAYAAFLVWMEKRRAKKGS